MTDIQKKLSVFEKSFELAKLENLLRWPNIFSILGVSRAEIRHSNFLCWLLNPRANHGLGDAFLRELCEAVNISVAGIDLSGAGVQREANYPKLENTAKERQIDLLITHEQFVIVLENKIDAADSPDQLRDYQTIAETAFPGKKRYYVYMTPSGDDPVDKAVGADWRLYSFERLCGHIDDVLERFADPDQAEEKDLNDVQKRVQMYLCNYCETIRRHILGNDNDLMKQAAEVYRAHKEAVDFIIENRADTGAGLFEIFARRVTESGWTEHSSGAGCVRFLTPALDAVIPKNRIGNKEAFLFELFFDPLRNKGKAVFKATVFNCLPQNRRVKDILAAAVKSVPGSQEPKGEKDIVHILVHYPFNISDDEALDAAFAEAQIDAFWPQLESLVKQAEAAILSRRAELEQAQKEARP